VRQVDQRHFFTQAGCTFTLIRFQSCSFANVRQNDIQIGGGTGIVRVVGCDIRSTGIAEGGASYTLQHSIACTVGAMVIVRDTDFSLVGGQSIRLSTATGTCRARISDCHNIGCGTGGAGLAASANEGDKSHFSINDGIVDVMVSDCTTDSTALYVAGTFNTSFFQGRQNKSARTDYDTHSSTIGGMYFGERHNGTAGIPTVASAAALTLPFQGSETPTFNVTGTTNITSVVATGWQDKTVRLIFAGALTFTDGSNLKLSGNFVTTADDVITLACDGTNWYEGARSVN
jgi:hypothetical protein